MIVVSSHDEKSNATEEQLQRLQSLQFRKGGAETRPAEIAQPANAKPAWITAGAGLVAGLAIALAGYGMYSWIGSGAEPAESTAAAPAATEANTPAPVVADLVASGYVVARRQATIASEVTGRITNISVEEGQRVGQGQTLATLDSSLARADVANRAATATSVSAGISGRQAELAEAEAMLVRTEALAEREFATRASLDAARSRVARARSDLEATRANLVSARASAAAAQTLLSQHRVTAPFSGVVVNLNAQIGEIISPLSAGGGFTRTGICTIVDMDSLEIEVDVSEASIGRVTIGQPVVATLNAYPDFEIKGSVKAVIPTADRQRASIRVRIALDTTDTRILPDMAAKVQFKKETQTS